MSLRGALLGLWHSGPMSGYELRRILDETYGYLWTAPGSQIYPTLRQMEREGLVAAEAQRTGKRERRVYRLTERGIEALLEWLDEPVAYAGERDAFHLKVAMMDLTSNERAEEHLQAHIAQHKARLATWQARVEAISDGSSRLLQARLRHRPASEHEALIAFKLCSYEGSIAQARAEIAWAEQTLDLVAQLRRAREQPAEAGARRPPRREAPALPSSGARGRGGRRRHDQ